MTTVIKPPVLRPAIPGGFSLDDFDIDTCAGTVTCPGRAHRHHPRLGDGQLRPSLSALPAAPPLHQLLEPAGSSRSIPITTGCTLARRQAEDPEFWTAYTTTRPMGERSISWLVADGCRKVRYRRLERNRHWLRLRCAAINLKRLDHPRPRPRRRTLDPGHHLTGGSGEASREPHLRASTQPGRPARTLKHRLFGRPCPGPTIDATPTRTTTLFSAS